MFAATVIGVPRLSAAGAAVHGGRTATLVAGSGKGGGRARFRRRRAGDGDKRRGRRVGGGSRAPRLRPRRRPGRAGGWWKGGGGPPIPLPGDAPEARCRGCGCGDAARRRRGSGAARPGRAFGRCRGVLWGGSLLPLSHLTPMGGERRGGERRGRGGSRWGGGPAPGCPPLRPILLHGQRGHSRRDRELGNRWGEHRCRCR